MQKYKEHKTEKSLLFDTNHNIKTFLHRGKISKEEFIKAFDASDFGKVEKINKLILKKNKLTKYGVVNLIYTKFYVSFKKNDLL